MTCFLKNGFGLCSPLYTSFLVVSVCSLLWTISSSISSLERQWGAWGCVELDADLGPVTYQLVVLVKVTSTSSSSSSPQIETTVIFQPGLVAHTCNPSTTGAEAGDTSVWGQIGLQSEFQATLGCIVKCWVRKKKQQKTEIKQTNCLSAKWWLNERVIK